MSKARTRSRGDQKQTQLSYTITPFGPSAGAPSSGVIAVSGYSGSFEIISDITQSGFRRSSDFRKWVSNPYSSAKLTVQISGSSATTSNTPDAQGNGLRRTWTGDTLGYLFGGLVPARGTASFGVYPDLNNTGNLTALAAVDCLNRINPAMNQSLIIAAEAGKTADMILSRAKKLALFAIAFKRGDRKLLDKISGRKPTRYPKRYVVWDDSGRPIDLGGGRTSRRYGHYRIRKFSPDRLTQAARLELEYRYGWTPLVHDIVDSLKAFNAATLRAELQKKDFTRVFGRKTSSKSSSRALTVTKDGGTFRGTEIYTHEVEVTAYAKYTVDQPESLANRLNDYGIFDVPRAVWDLATLSFVVDWFIPIGDWLGAISPKVGVNVIESGVSTRVTKKVTRRLDSYTASGTGVGQWPDSPVTIGTTDSFVVVGKSRSIGLSPPLFPPHEVNLNLKRIADAVALFRVMR